MKNKLFFILIFFLFCTKATFSQIKISGIVYIENGPIENAAVYFNNSMIGTTTKEDGTFSLETKEGKFELIISFLGYKTINYKLDTNTYEGPLNFALVEDENQLEEIVIKKTVYDEEWQYNLSAFKREFIGTTELAEDCKILNPKVLYFDFDARNNILTAYARKPLQIEHKSLGYKITYDLEHFVINNRMVTYLGFARYENIKASKRKKRKWEANRLKTYNGSYTHFYQTLLKNTTYEEGFLIHLFKRIPNPERPSDEEIKKARDIIRLSSKVVFSNDIDNPKTALDSAQVTLRKARLPKYKDQIYKTNAPVSEVLSKENLNRYLNIEHNIMVIYTKELEEEKYIMRNVFSRKRKAYPQSSNVITLKNPTQIDINGLLVNPLNIYYEGYWSFEKFANTLPLDYSPN